MTLERLGIPTVTIVSTAFLGLATAQAKAMGCPDLRMIVIPHPYKTLTAEQVEQLSQRIFNDVVLQVTAQGGTEFAKLSGQLGSADH